MVKIASSGKISIAGSANFTPFFAYFYFLFSKIIISYKWKIQKVLLAIVLIASFLNALRYSILIGHLEPRLQPEKAAELLQLGTKKEDLIMTGDIDRVMPIFAYLNIPLKIITSQKKIDDVRVDKSDFILNNFSLLEEAMVTENFSLGQYRRLWIIYEDSQGFPDIGWFSAGYSGYLAKTFHAGGYTLMLYDVR